MTAQKASVVNKTYGDALKELLVDPPEDAFNVADLSVGGGTFVGIDPSKTTDQGILNIQAAIKKLNDYWSVPYLNEEGEEISDQVIVHDFKRKQDGTIELGDNGKPITGANHALIKRTVPIRQYVTKAIIGSDKFPSDGVLIVRVM
jgi:hypothetical protein